MADRDTEHAIAIASDAEAAAICSALQTHNRARIGMFDVTGLQLCVRDDTGRVCGGVVGHVYLGWFAIDVLWVDDAVRGHGIGTRLLRAAEDQARTQGATAAFLDTFSWQAETFWRRMGYLEFGRLPDFPGADARIFLQRTLID